MAFAMWAAERDRQQRNTQYNDATYSDSDDADPLTTFFSPICDEIFQEIQNQCVKFSSASFYTREFSVHENMKIGKFAYLKIEFNAYIELKIVATPENQINVTIRSLFMCPKPLLAKIVKPTDVFAWEHADKYIIDKLVHIETEQKFSDYINPILKIVTPAVVLRNTFEGTVFNRLEPTEFTCMIIKHTMGFLTKEFLFSVQVTGTGFRIVNDTTHAYEDIHNIYEMRQLFRKATGIKARVDAKLDLHLQKVLTDIACELDKLMELHM